MWFTKAFKIADKKREADAALQRFTLRRRDHVLFFVARILRIDWQSFEYLGSYASVQYDRQVFTQAQKHEDAGIVQFVETGYDPDEITRQMLEDDGSSKWPKH